MKTLIAALLGLVAFEGIASGQTMAPRIAYDECSANQMNWDYYCVIVAGGSGVAWAWGQDSVLGPKWSPDGSRVAFVGGNDIFVASLGGGPITNLTNHLGGSSPAWSRDGGTIAFSSQRDGVAELYVMNADGSNVRRLTDHIGFNGRPAWSPDNSRIGFGCELEIGNQDICTINADGSGLVRQTRHPSADYGPVFSPESKIAFVTDRFGMPSTAVLEDGETRLVSEGVDPAWSPDGSRIAYASSDGDVFVIAAAGGNAVNVTNDGLGYYGPVWSPDGGQLTFGGTSIAGYTGTCYFDEGGAHNADNFCAPAFGVYVANADGSAHSLFALGGRPDWFVPSSGRPLSSFTYQCSGSVCDFDASGSWDSDGTIASYAWEFGDGTSGSGPTPHHAYAIGNQYVVTLTVTDDSGVTAGVNITVDANAPPVAVLTASCSGRTCTFDASGSSDPDGTIATYSLSFGDGHSTGSMTTAMASHAYVPGTFTATLYVTDNAGASATRTATITVINLPPVASFTHACHELTCSFDASAAADPDGTIQSYLWTFGDGSGGAGATTSRQFAATGSYVVTLTVFDNGGERAAVSQTITVAVTVVPTMHVGDLDLVGANHQTAWTAVVTIAIHAGNHAPVAGATVSGSWSNGLSGSCMTNGFGRCTLSNGAIPKKIGSITFTVVNVTHPTSTYRPVNNHDPDGDSSGVTVRVIKP